MNGKKIFFGTLKWISIILIGGAGWIALLAFIIVQGFSEGGTRLGLPIVDIDSTEFWSHGFEGDIPRILTENGKLVATSNYGFTDLMFVGLVKLSNENRKKILDEHFEGIGVDKDYQSSNEKMLCIGSADLALSWQIDNEFISDYFDFCSQISQDISLNWKSIEFVEKENDDIGFSYMNIHHLVGTQYFTVSHGKS